MARSDQSENWLACLKRAAERDPYSTYTDEKLADLLAEQVGFPLDGHEKIDVYEFWDLIISGLKSKGYKVVDLLEDESENVSFKEKKQMIEKIKRFMNG